MRNFVMLGYIWIFTSISLCIGLYKLELSKRVIDEEYEYIKKNIELLNRPLNVRPKILTLRRSVFLWQNIALYLN